MVWDHLINIVVQCCDYDRRDDGDVTVALAFQLSSEDELNGTVMSYILS